MKKVIISIVVMSLISSGVGVGPSVADPVPETNTGDGSDRINVAAVDVGQGDAIVVWSDNETMVIDTGGYLDNGEQVRKFLTERLNRSKVDYLVSTHTDSDHIGGNENLIKNLNVESVYRSNLTSTSATYSDYITALNNAQTNDYIARAGDQIPFGAANVTVLHPSGDTSRTPLTTSTKNDDSVVLHIDDGKSEYLMMGDLDTDTELELVRKYPELTGDIDVLKVGHHGADTSTDRLFLDYAEPSLALISAPAESTYGHPVNSTLRLLDRQNIATGWTGISGTIVVEHNTTGLYMSGQVDGTTDPGNMTDILSNPTATANVDPWNLSYTEPLSSVLLLDSPDSGSGSGDTGDNSAGNGSGGGGLLPDSGLPTLPGLGVAGSAAVVVGGLIALRILGD